MSRIGDWWLRQYPAPEPEGVGQPALTKLEASVEHVARNILIRAKQYSAPVSLAHVATALRVKRLPVFVEEQAGGFSPEYGLIALRGRLDQLRLQGPAYQRLRFSFAHELGHSLFYDMSSLPGFRLAPEVAGDRVEWREEEKISNLFARLVLVPTFILESRLSGDPNPWHLLEVKRSFRVSIEVAAVSIESYFSRNCAPNTFYLMSRNTGTFNQARDRELRSLACVRYRSLPPPFYYDERPGKYGPTSIQEAACRSAKHPMAVEETFHSRWGPLRARLTHYRLGENIVWTEGRLLERPDVLESFSKPVTNSEGTSTK